MKRFFALLCSGFAASSLIGPGALLNYYTAELLQLPKLANSVILCLVSVRKLTS